MSKQIKSSEITDESTYLNRRNFLKVGIAAGSLAATTSAFRYFSPVKSNAPEPPALAEIKRSETPPTDLKTNTYEEITNYNNFYEFSTSKSAVAAKAESLVTRPWTVEVGGMVQRPRTFDIEDLLKFEQEERIYRFRCVEAWSMVIPWVGFSLKKLLAPATSHFRPNTIRSGCNRRFLPVSTFHTLRDCGSTKPSIR